MEEKWKELVLSKVNQDRVVTLLQDMVRIPSYTGEELQIAEFMAHWLAKHGFEVDLQECTPTKYHTKSANVVGILRGTGGGKSLMLNGHLDTDPACGTWRYDPWDPLIFDGNKINGIGTTNMKGGDAAMIEAVLAIMDAGIRLKGDILITLVCRELQGGWGIAKVLEKYTSAAGIVTEPTSLTLGFNPSAGGEKIQVQIYGKTAHIHEREKAINATVKMAKVIAALDQLNFPYTRKLAPPINADYPWMIVSASRSGIGDDFYDGRPPTVGDRALIKMDVRYDTNQTLEMIYRDIQDVMDRLQSEDPELRAKVEPIPTYIPRPPFDMPWDSFIFDVIGKAHKYVLGEEVKTTPSIGGHDGAFMWTKSGIPTAVYGIGGGSRKDPGMLVDTEDIYTTVEQLVNLSKVLSLCCLEICNMPKK